jgi:hypothetical protein
MSFTYIYNNYNHRLLRNNVYHPYLDLPEVKKTLRNCSKEQLTPLRTFEHFRPLAQKKTYMQTYTVSSSLQIKQKTASESNDPQVNCFVKHTKATFYCDIYVRYTKPYMVSATKYRRVYLIIHLVRNR